MTDKQAKLILQSYRPGVSSPSDPEFASALEYVRRNPDLEAWFEQEQARDTVISDKLFEAPVPEGLLDSILDGASSEPKLEKVVSPWRHYAIAASILFLLSISVWLGNGLLDQPSEYASFRGDMAEFLDEFPRLDVESERLPEIENWLRSRDRLQNASVPEKLRRFPGIGCRTIDWNDRKFALVCFSVSGEIVHLIVFPSDRLEGDPESATPIMDRVGNWRTASWNRDGNVYLALTRGSEEFVKKQFAGG